MSLHHFSSYKLSIHTGSNKFIIYSIINNHSQGYVHVKTAGTSYLEAIRIIAYQDPTLFRKMLDLAHKRFEKVRRRYFLDCQPQNVPTNDQLTDLKLDNLLEQFDSRQMLHVTFSSILNEHGDDQHALLATFTAYSDA